MSIPVWLQGMLKDGRYESVYEMSYQWRIREATIYRWLSGKSRPSVSYCIKLAQLTGTPVEQVVLMAAAGDVRTSCD